MKTTTITQPDGSRTTVTERRSVGCLSAAFWTFMLLLPLTFGPLGIAAYAVLALVVIAGMRYGTR